MHVQLCVFKCKIVKYRIEKLSADFCKTNGVANTSCTSSDQEGEKTTYECGKFLFYFTEIKPFAKC